MTIQLVIFCRHLTDSQESFVVLRRFVRSPISIFRS